eukprot:CAMPEP_0195084354 /NCGR_PEP_ID=MMETSP0448-20130528/25066_1 /TAXON_ID=66468 /ORGANISM="Heterocapsa triquestra, Strain CCMP 448" /LENGTH=89 /DNA_ID=CAMNT_0040117657 /DNA_START=174 /DNA_END=440 /DNA_ORIENTATION=+
MPPRVRGGTTRALTLWPDFRSEQEAAREPVRAAAPCCGARPMRGLRDGEPAGSPERFQGCSAASAPSHLPPRARFWPRRPAAEDRGAPS